MPDATTLLKFYRLPEQHDLSSTMLSEINALLTERGLLMRQGTVVNATSIAMPSPTKIDADKRDDITGTQAEGPLRKEIDWRIAMKRGQLRAMREGPLSGP